MTAPAIPAPQPDLYRWEHTPAGERLVPVTDVLAATHASIKLLRRLSETQARETAGMRAELEHVRERLQARESKDAALQETATQCQMAVQQLLAKNAALIGEKRRLRDALTGKHPLPNVHYRIEIGRDDIARESLVVTLDTFPHRERVRDALAEARRLAHQHSAHLRQVRLDTVSWRAVLQREIDA